MLRNYIGYKNVCWSCGKPVTSETNVRCDLCGWYICNFCGACSQGECFGTIGTTAEERRYLRNKYREQDYSLLNATLTSWCNEQLSLKKQEEKEELERQRKIEKEAAEKEELLTEQEWLQLKQNPSIIHVMFGEGMVTDSYRNGKSRYFTVHFDKLNEDKLFSFPHAFRQNYLSFKEATA